MCNVMQHMCCSDAVYTGTRSFSLYLFSESTGICEVHMQVHLVLVSRGHDSVLTRTLQEAASSLSGLNAVHSPSARPLLPEAIKVGSEDLCLGQQPMRVMGGSLASNNQGGLGRANQPHDVC